MRITRDNRFNSAFIIINTMLLKIDYFKGKHSLSCVYSITFFSAYPFVSTLHLCFHTHGLYFLIFPGPVIRAEVGDTIQVVFYNRASKPFSMQPHGVFYEKDYEGTVYNDGELEVFLSV